MDDNTIAERIFHPAYLFKKEMRKTKLFAGHAHPELTSAISDRLAMHASSTTVQTYPNHELSLYLESSVRGDDVFILQSGADSINDHLMELLILVQACKISSAARITAVIPYFPYGKWSKKKRARGPITAKRTPSMSRLLICSCCEHVGSGWC
jgi:ribose-phosphate pyrophosphokinase